MCRPGLDVYRKLTRRLLEPSGQVIVMDSCFLRQREHLPNKASIIPERSFTATPYHFIGTGMLFFWLNNNVAVQKKKDFLYFLYTTEHNLKFFDMSYLIWASRLFFWDNSPHTKISVCVCALQLATAALLHCCVSTPYLHQPRPRLHWDENHDSTRLKLCSNEQGAGRESRATSWLLPDWPAEGMRSCRDAHLSPLSIRGAAGSHLAKCKKKAVTHIWNSSLGGKL